MDFISNFKLKTESKNNEVDVCTVVYLDPITGALNWHEDDLEGIDQLMNILGLSKGEYVVTSGTILHYLADT